MNPRVRYLVTTLALVGVAVVWNALDRPAPPLRPARAATPATVVRPRPALPTAADLLAKREALALSPDQRARLGALAAQWGREAATREAEVAAASEEFARFMADAQKIGRTRLDDVRERSVEVQERSAALRERRARHSEEAIGMLTERQRARLAAENGIPGGAR